MKKFGFAAIVATGLAAGVLGFASPALAAPTGTAADAVKSLQGAGYDVQINGAAQAPLSQCTVTGIHGLNNSNVNSADQWSNGAAVSVPVAALKAPTAVAHTSISTSGSSGVGNGTQSAPPGCAVWVHPADGGRGGMVGGGAGG